MTFSREAVKFFSKAVKFFSKAVKFSRAAVTFFGRNSHQPRQNSFYDLSHHACKYIIVITVNEPGVGCFLLVPIIIRARAGAGATAAWLSHRRAGTYTDGTPVGASPWGSKHTGTTPCATYSFCQESIACATAHRRWRERFTKRLCRFTGKAYLCNV